MTTKLNLNQSPYFDDYDKTKKYHQILFRPGRAVQARELTQLQTILQQQIERFGTHVFKQGANVIPGTDNAVRFVRDIPFIKVAANQNTNTHTTKAIESNWLDQNIICTTNGREGIEAKIIGYRFDNIDGGEVRFFLSPKSSSISGSDSFFRPNDTIRRTNDNQSQNVIQIPNNTTKIGLTSSVTVQDGVYFYNGYFIYVDAQTIFLTPENPDNPQNQSSWNNSATATVGLKITESIKTYQLNRDLLDNATGTPNQSAPGADRLHIDAELIQIPYAIENQLPENFIKLLDVVAGEARFITNKTEYNLILDTLARRTYDESGDYVVNDFVIHVKDFLRDEESEQDGVHDIKEFQFVTLDQAKEYSLQKFKHLLSTTQIQNGGVATQHPNETGAPYYPGSSYDALGDKTSFKNLCDGFLSIRVDPGKAYVKGYEIQKLARTTIDVPKSRSTKFVNNNILTTSIGPYFNITNLSARTNLESIQTVELHKIRANDPLVSPDLKIGTAKLVSIESSELPGQYRAHLTDIKMINGAEIYEVKSIFSSANPAISANIVLTELALTGSVSGQAGTNTIKGSGTRWKTNIGEQLKQNDYVRIGSSYYKIIENPTTDTDLIIDSTLTSSISGETIYYTYAILNTDQTPGLLFPLSHEYVSTIRGSGPDDSVAETSDIVYSIPTFIPGAQSGQYHSVVDGICTVSFPGSQLSGDRFDIISNSYKIISNAGKWYIPSPGTTEPISNNVVNIELLSDGSLKLRFESSSTPTQIQLIAPIIRNGKKERKKTLRTGTITVEQKENSEINLNQYDVFRITKIVTSTSSEVNPNPNTDKRIEALYALDTGQRDFYYDKAKVTLRAGYEKPKGKVLVEFEYFEHSEDGDYFSVDSYAGYISNNGTFSPGISYGEIPNYTSSSGRAYALTDCLDFRRKLNSSSGKSPVQRIVCDYHFYNSRNDKIILSSKTQNFELSLGTPDLFAQPAPEISDGLTICELLHKPFGITRESCILKYLDNRRYTMRDIGKLEKRIKNLEYYTTLSLLEKETSELTITDANGNNRFKNGFLVDNFSSFDSSDISSPEFSCSIDMVNERCARPLINDDYIALKETLDPEVGIVSLEASADARKTVGHYSATNGLYTLPYTKKIFISQGIASKVININPFNVQAYIGELRLTPWTDAWRETKTLEPIIIKDENAYTQALNNINGQINYSAPFEVFSDTTAKEPQKKGGKKNQRILKGGHEFLEKLQKENPKAYENARRTGKFKVPEPYINAGQIVPVHSGATEYQYRYAQKTTVNTTTIRTGLENSVVDLGFSENRALTKSELSEIQFIRSREIKFSGTSFRPNSNLYAFFDNIPVSEDCRPILNGDAGWSTYKIIDVYSLLAIDPDNSISNQFEKLPADTKTKIFLIQNGVNFRTTQVDGRTDNVGVVRAGCEIQYTTKSGILKKFEVLSVSPTGDHLTCIQKEDSGLIAEYSSQLEPNDNTINQLSEGYDIRVSKHTFGDQLQADGSGRVFGAFKIPNRQAKRFKTGDVTFTLSSSNISGTSADTSASARYTAKGLLNTEQYTITQTRQFTVASNAVDPDINNSSTPGNDIYSWGPVIRRDPIAQTFLVRETGGCFITDIEVFFAKKPANNNGQILLELRAADERGPLSAIIGGDLGKVSAKENKNIVINKVTYDNVDELTGALNKKLEILVDVDADLKEIGAEEDQDGNIIWNSETAVKPQGVVLNKIENSVANVPYVNSTLMSELMVPTRFTFDAPVYLEEGKTYAFVLLSDSDEYEVWIAQRGPVTQVDSNMEYNFYSKEGESNVKIGTTSSIDGEKLYVDGDFYKSKNGFGWDIDPTISIKFNLFKAKFDITDSSEISFVNEELTEVPLFVGAIESKANFNQLRIAAPNHGFSIREKVKFSINTDTNGLLGIPRDVFDSPLEITRTEIDHFVVDMGLDKTATQSGRLGGTSAARINKRFEQAILTTNAFVPGKEAAITYNIQTTPTAGVHQFNEIGQPVTITNAKLNSREVVPNVSIEFDSPMKVNTTINEQSNNTTINDINGSVTDKQNYLLSRKSVVVKAILNSTNENLSPVLDSNRVGLALISTRLDNPSGVASTNPTQTVINDVFDELEIFNGSTLPGTTTTIADKLEFSASQAPIPGKASQLELDTIITLDPINTETIDVRKILNLGDKVFDFDSNQERTVVEILSANEFRVNLPFNPSLKDNVINGITIPKRIYTVAKSMEITTDDNDIAKNLSQVDIGKYITFKLSDQTTENSTPIEDLGITFEDSLVIDVEYSPDLSPKAKVVVEHINSGNPGTALQLSGLGSDAGNVGVSLIQKDRFISEIAPTGGSAATKYISKKLNLDATCNALRVSFDAIRDSSCDIVLYYRTEQPNDQTPAFEKNWIKAEYNIEVNGVLTTKTPAPNADSFVSYESTLNGLPSFTGVQVKIVMLGGNPAKAPKIKNLKVIALDE